MRTRPRRSIARSTPALRAAVIAFAAPAAARAGDCEPHWLTALGETDLSGNVHSLAAFDGGSGPSLVAGGAFSSPRDGAFAVAEWNGAGWQPLGDTAAIVEAQNMTVYDHGTGPRLYVDGWDLRRWDGAQWSVVPGSPIGVHSGLGVFDDGGGAELFVSGGFAFFPTPDGLAEYIARWNGESWLTAGSELNSVALDYAVFDDGGGPAFYAAGGFGFFEGGGLEAGVARWDGAHWSAVGSSTNGGGYALAVFDDGGGPGLYLGGTFSQAGGATALNIARWSGAGWEPVGGGVNGAVWALAVFDDGDGEALFAAGDFTEAGGLPASHVARWDGAQWAALGAGADAVVRALLVTALDGSDLLVAAGTFTSVDGRAAQHFAAWGCEATITGDLDGDGAVAFTDLLILLGAWGPCGGSCPPGCPADLNLDCAVDFADLLLLLANWT